MTPQKKQRVSKLGAAQRQLRTAVSLFFNNGDDVSIHTLVAASRQLLIDILKHQGKRSPFEDSYERVFTPEGVKEFRAAIVADENFFKHADRDPRAERDFDPGSSVFMLVECASAYELATGRVLRELWVFMLWFACEYPGALRPGTLLDAVKAIQAKPGASPHHQRRLFFEALNSPQLYPNLD